MSGESTQKPRRRRAGRHSGGTVLGILFGLVLGLVAALSVAWFVNRASLPFVNKARESDARVATAPASTAPAQAPGATALDPARQGTPTTPAPVVPPPAAGDAARTTPEADAEAARLKAEQKTKDEAKLKAEEAKAKAAAEEAKKAGGWEAGSQYYLQVGSFQNAGDADNLKAKLALIGLEAAVSEVNLADKGVMHRVRVGPFTKPEDMNRARTVLAQNGIGTSLIKAR